MNAPGPANPARERSSPDKQSARHRPSAAQIAETLAQQRTLSAPEPGLFRQIWRRRILPIVGAYLAGGIAAMSGIDQLVQQDLLVPIVYRLGLALFVAGLNAVIILGWFHGEKGRQRVSRAEIVLLGVVFISWLVGTALILS